MITAKFDMPKLLKSLNKAAKGFGETNKQAVARWGVQTCRELAVSTQVFGKGGARKKQVNAIEVGIHSVICEVPERVFRDLQSGKKKTAKIRNRWVQVSSDRLLTNEQAAEAWIERHRGAKGHTKALDQNSIGIAPKSVVAAVKKARREKAGMAKGAWLGAGVEIAKHQKGTDRINIGKNFLGYAQKHSRRGHAKPSGNPFKAIATLSNKAKHSGSSYVLSESQKSKAIGFGAKKTIAWYRRAAKAALDKK